MLGDIRRNLPASIVVLLISVPLAMGIAIASGVPPARGLITAIIGGLVIASLGGSALQVSGPSAGQAIMVLEAVNAYGVRVLGVVVPIMGLLQMGAGALRLGQVFRAVSPAVINGMLAGIGILLLSSQFHVMMDDTPKDSGFENLITMPLAAYKGLVPMNGSAHHWAALIGAMTLLVVVAMTAVKRGPLSKVPPSLAAVVVTTMVVWWFDLPIRRVNMPESLLLAFAPPGTEDLALFTRPGVLLTAFALAFVSTAETLLCANAADAMHSGPRTNYDRELIAQGIGNTLCGFLGAPPASGVVTRTTANIQAGATSKASAIMVGLWTLLIVVLVPSALSIIPRACLAALLVYIGFNLARTRPVGELRRYGRTETAIFFITLSTIVLANLLIGILVGVALGTAKLIHSRGKRFHRLEIEVVTEADRRQTHLHLRGSASFIRIPRLASVLEKIPMHHEVHLHVEELEYIDHACLDLLTQWERERMRARSPVRVQWKTLHHRYHAGNPLDPTPAEHAEVPEEPERLLDFLKPELIVIDPPFSDKWEAIEYLGRHIARTHRMADDAEGLITSVAEREKDMTTCIGHGLMIPHGTLLRETSMHGAMALSRRGWDFDAPDGNPVRCIVLLATPEGEASRHLAVLAAFARLFMNAPDLRDALLNARSAQEAWDLLHRPGSEAINYAFESPV